MLFVVLSLFLSQNLCAQTKAESENIFAKSYDYVNDFEKILTPNQIKSLTEFLKSSEARTKNKILIVTVASIIPYTDLSDYSRDLDNYLISKLNIDTSILIVISKQLRQIQVQSIDLIRYKLSDNDTQNIITTYAVPEFKKGDYSKGLELAVEQIMNKLKVY